MKKTMIGLAVILFAILLQLCSSGIELLTLGTGIIGLIFTIVSGLKAE